MRSSLRAYLVVGELDTTTAEGGASGGAIEKPDRPPAFSDLNQPHKSGVVYGGRRRSDQDALEETLREQLVFLREMRERALKSMSRVRSRSGSSSSPSPPRDTSGASPRRDT